MSIHAYEYYHGAALNRIIDSGKSLEIMTFPSDSNSSITINKNIGVFFKYSQLRISPWRFTFKKEHQDELMQMKELHKKLFIVFICFDDGFACLEWSELKKILDYDHKEVEFVSIKRMRKEKYTVNGSDGKLKYKIGQNEFPKKIIESLI